MDSALALNIPGYTIERLICEGGMATVYLAVQESLGRQVALKILRRFDNPVQSDRFLNEGRMIASLHHPNIITIHDVGVVDGQHYIAMEYLRGGTLEERIKQGLAERSVLQIMISIGRCLDFVHRNDLVHRDIKPANILFHEDGTLKLTDFGVAKDLLIDRDQTMDGMALGSPYYISPEQARGSTPDGRSDLYSLGIIFYEMLTGRKPYVADSAIETILAHLDQPIPVLPEELAKYQKFLERMLAKQVDHRFSSAAEMVGYLIAVREMNSDSRNFRARNAQNTWSLADFFPVTGSWRIDAITAGFLLVALTLVLVDFSDSQPETVQQAVTFQKPEGAPKNEFPAIDQQLIKQDKTEIVETGIISADINDLDIATQPVEQLTRFAETLHKGDMALAEYRLVTPAQNNAFYYYQWVLEDAPDNEHAQQGLVRIADTYVNLINKQLQDGNIEVAERFLKRGLAVMPGHADLLQIEEKLLESPSQFTSKEKKPKNKFFGFLKSIYDKAVPSKEQGSGN